MPEPLKNLYNEVLINSLCHALKAVYKPFQSNSFHKSIFDETWEKKELKQRMRHIAETLYKFLPQDYKQAVEILKQIAADFNGFEYMFFPDFVELYGLEDYEPSIIALEYFTEFSSSEFAVRVFIKKYPDKMMAQMEKWAESNNYHLRRLASEGCRPRLPWAMSLPEFKKNPQAVLKVLEKLKQDESQYVRRSVANNLNDISKDNPQVVIQLAKTWAGENKNIDWMVKHGCRSLLKQAEPEIMDLFGFENPKHIFIDGFEVQKSVCMGHDLEFSFLLHTQKHKLGKLRIEYAIDFMKNNGKQSRKLFKISEADYAQSKKVINKKYSFKPISTRKYYAGLHGIAVLVNGYELTRSEFQLFN